MATRERPCTRRRAKEIEELHTNSRIFQIDNGGEVGPRDILIQDLKIEPEQVKTEPDTEPERTFGDLPDNNILLEDIKPEPVEQKVVINFEEIVLSDSSSDTEFENEKTECKEEEADIFDQTFEVIDYSHLNTNKVSQIIDPANSHESQDDTKIKLEQNIVTATTPTSKQIVLIDEDEEVDVVGCRNSEDEEISFVISKNFKDDKKNFTEDNLAPQDLLTASQSLQCDDEKEESISKIVVQKENSNAQLTTSLSEVSINLEKEDGEIHDSDDDVKHKKSYAKRKVSSVQRSSCAIIREWLGNSEKSNSDSNSKTSQPKIQRSPNLETFSSDSKTNDKGSHSKASRIDSKSDNKRSPDRKPSSTDSSNKDKRSSRKRSRSKEKSRPRKRSRNKDRRSRSRKRSKSKSRSSHSKKLYDCSKSKIREPSDCETNCSHSRHKKSSNKRRRSDSKRNERRSSASKQIHKDSRRSATHILSPDSETSRNRYKRSRSRSRSQNRTSPTFNRSRSISTSRSQDSNKTVLNEIVKVQTSATSKDSTLKPNSPQHETTDLKSNFSPEIVPIIPEPTINDFIEPKEQHPDDEITIIDHKPSIKNFEKRGRKSSEDVQIIEDVLLPTSSSTTKTDTTNPPIVPEKCELAPKIDEVILPNLRLTHKDGFGSKVLVYDPTTNPGTYHEGKFSGITDGRIVQVRRFDGLVVNVDVFTMNNFNAVVQNVAPSKPGSIRTGHLVLYREKGFKFGVGTITKSSLEQYRGITSWKYEILPLSPVPYKISIGLGEIRSLTPPWLKKVYQTDPHFKRHYNIPIQSTDNNINSQAS